MHRECGHISTSCVNVLVYLALQCGTDINWTMRTVMLAFGIMYRKKSERELRTMNVCEQRVAGDVHIFLG